MLPRVRRLCLARQGCLVVGLLACSHSTEPPPSPVQVGMRPELRAETSVRAMPAPLPSAGTARGRLVPLPEVTGSRQNPWPIPAPSGALPPVPVWDQGLANLDPNDDDVVGPPNAIPDCEARLQAANVRYRPSRLPIIAKRGFSCGAPQVLEYLEGPEHIRYRPAPLVTCQLALALAHFEQVLNRLAQELLGVRVTSITQGGTYSCRSMARFRLVSEHSYANAIDLYAFGLSDGQTVSVVKHFGRPTDAPAAPASQFLRQLAQRCFDEDVFSVVVTRYFDELHRDHIHVDMAHYRTDGSR